MRMERIMTWKWILVVWILVEELVHCPVAILLKHNHCRIVCNEVCPNLGIVRFACSLPVNPLCILVGHAKGRTGAPLAVTLLCEEDQPLSKHINALTHVLIDAIVLQEVAKWCRINVDNLNISRVLSGCNHLIHF